MLVGGLTAALLVGGVGVAKDVKWMGARVMVLPRNNEMLSGRWVFNTGGRSSSHFNLNAYTLMFGPPHLNSLGSKGTSRTPSSRASK